jgi:hypothetical protein
LPPKKAFRKALRKGTPREGCPGAGEAAAPAPRKGHTSSIPIPGTGNFNLPWGSHFRSALRKGSREASLEDLDCCLLWPCHSVHQSRSPELASREGLPECAPEEDAPRNTVQGPVRQPRSSLRQPLSHERATRVPSPSPAPGSPSSGRPLPGCTPGRLPGRQAWETWIAAFCDFATASISPGLPSWPPGRAFRSALRKRMPRRTRSTGR